MQTVEVTKCPPGIAKGAYFQRYIRPAHGLIRFEGKRYPLKSIRPNMGCSLEDRDFLVSPEKVENRETGGAVRQRRYIAKKNKEKKWH